MSKNEQTNEKALNWERKLSDIGLKKYRPESQETDQKRIERENRRMRFREYRKEFVKEPAMGYTTEVYNFV